MVVTQVFRRLGKRLDRPFIAAKLNLRINDTSFHRPLPLSRCEVSRRIQTIRVRAGTGQKGSIFPEHLLDFLGVARLH
jgi:hypothetical protein